MTTAVVGKSIAQRILPLVLAVFMCPAWGADAPSVDPLPSWSDGGVKQVIEQFVAEVTTVGGANYVPPADRIAVFDNDGTLWSEKPWVQGLFLQQMLRNAVNRHPALAAEQPYKAALENNREFFVTGGIPAILPAIKSIMVELSREAFDAEVQEFFATTRHPFLNVPFRQTVYQPAIELLAYLRSHGFKTFICSGGGADFMRVISRDFYGIEAERVIGTSYKKELHEIAGKWVLQTTSELNPINNKAQKAVNIDLHIGQRPLLVMGNAGGKGDIGMLGYSQGRDGPSLQLLIDHNDAAHEFAYAEKDSASLNAAKAHGWHIISMKDDWAAIYPPGEK